MVFISGISRGLLNQYCAGLAACMIMTSIATNYAWMSPLLSYFQGPDSDIPMTSAQASWLVSIIAIAAVLSSFPCAILCNKIGRKPIILALGPVNIISWALFLYYPSVTMLGAARILQGLSLGAGFASVPTYLGEIAGKSTRGAIASLCFNAWWLGLLFAYAVGSWLSYRYFTYFTMALNVPFLLLFIWQPESPYYHVMIGNEEGALETLAWFSTSPPEKLKEELKEIQVSLEARSSTVSLLSDPVERNGLLITFMLNILKAFGGISPVIVYATQIFKLTPNSPISPDIVTVVFGVFMLACSCLGSCGSDTFGRRTLLIVSCFGAMVCQFLTGTYYYFLFNTSFDVSSFGWVAIILILLTSGFFTAGLFPVCAAYGSELFSSSTRSVASSLGNIINFGSIFLSVFIYQAVEDYFGLFMNFYIYSLFLALGTLYLYKSAPETKGKSFAEIRTELSINKGIHPTLNT